jgi:hypothetical protein
MNALSLIRQDNGKITIAEFLAIVRGIPDVKDLKTQNVFAPRRRPITFMKMIVLSFD